MMGAKGERSPWKPITTAPQSGFGKPRCYVLVRGPSQVSDTEHFVVKAYHDAEYRPIDPWRMVDHSAISGFWMDTDGMDGGAS